MPESSKSRRMRWMFNFFPAYWSTGATVTYIAGNYQELRIKLPLTWRTRNYVGTIYGGSMYAAVDPLYMLMLMQILGKDYVVWDKAASIRFKKPGTRTLYATFIITDEVLAEIQQKLSEHGEVNHTFHLDIVDEDGTVHTSVEKLVYVATKVHYKEKQQLRAEK